MSHPNSIKTNEKGQTLVEFALILPILLLLVMGIIQFGIIFSAQIGITNAAREGARAAAVGMGMEEIKDRIEGALGSHIALTFDKSTDIDVTPALDNVEVGDEITVSVTGYVELIVPMPEGIFENPIRLDAKSSMRVENKP